MRIVFLGSGAFGLPTLEALLRSHTVVLGVTQPDRLAGRGLLATATPVAQRLAEGSVETIKPEDVNASEVVSRVHAARPDALVVIAFGQKLRPALLEGLFAINLHGSLLPRHRGAAPVNWAILSGDTATGVSVITLAQRMDAGEILAEGRTAIDPQETAGELHDRLAEMGPSVVLEALERRSAGTLAPRLQEESLATRAPKLTRADAWLRFDQAAEAVRRRVHGLSPWPGCAVELGGVETKLLRVDLVESSSGGGKEGAAPGTLDEHGAIRCASGALRPVLVQQSGKRAMIYDEFRRGRRLAPGDVARSIVAPPVPGSPESTS